ncbi:energy-coupled thiamine transporter ThiT [Sporosarcina pasteurii]|uniref:Thiamine ECF transporter S component ThiT n=1 Tax=Sporosarcina pasteurii TaxID=1474 RepID=A0A380CBE2_SPOPA|nr:energy-coupled thiamine transporter ThiT [Sporosarcina pasteurii]MDS9473352.1 energy-coupled thiamine transporter ThiT [Sporosarcina pasteurii]QBQ04267.1 energy-coupled thiamine transporter ThiT [Sporosarcina pasteurii]SUJ16981.1 Thiamine ECF transporter S component ThiT [Sporosarcina pasteurii]
MQRKRLQFLMEVAILGALSFILDKLTVFVMPQGGSITLSMLPIIVMAFRWGISGGLLTGFLSGLLQLITGGTIFHWAQALMDYTLAYTLVGIAAITGIWLANSMAKGRKGSMVAAIVIGSVIGGLLRFFIHFVGGIVFFGEYAPAGQPVWLYSLVYNASYMIPSILLCSIVASLLFTSAPRLLKTA